MKAFVGIRKGLEVMAVILTVMLIASCSKKNVSDNPEALDTEKENVVIGFSQVGSESSWRVANSESMKSALSEENGFELIFDDAKQKQENQYKAIRRFIQQNVDYIVLAPITEDGWDDVLIEARKAKIPVIIVDRKVNVRESSSYVSWVGSDFAWEGKKAVDWLEDELELRGMQENGINILHLKGTIGATAQLMRTEELEKGAAKHDNWTVVGTLEGEYTEAKSYELTKEFLETQKDIDVVYCENDNMAFGVMRALDEAGLKYGGEDGIIIISFDAVSSALEECLKGNISLCVECNPLHGPRVMRIIDQLEHSMNPPKLSYVEETLFSYRTITREIIDERKY